MAPLPDGSFSQNDGATEVLRLSVAPVETRYVRILLHESSGTAPAGTTDIRDSLGFPINELYISTLEDNGTFHDAIAHAAHNTAQTVTYTSSTDPWHRAIDLDPNTEQLGFVFGSGLTNNLPVLGGQSFQSGIVYTGFDVNLNKPWYPFDDLCQQPTGQLLEQPELLASVFREFRQNGLPHSLPVIISEFGYSEL